MEKLNPIKTKTSTIISICYNSATCLSGLIALFLGFVDDDVLKTHHLDVITKCMTGIASLLLACWFIFYVLIPKIKQHIETKIINKDKSLQKLELRIKNLEIKKAKILKAKTYTKNSIDKNETK